MKLTVADVLGRLGRESLLPPDSEQAARVALAAEMENELPWFVRLAVGVGAYAATGFFVMFVSMWIPGTQHATRLVLALILAGLALLLERRASRDFLVHLSVAMSLVAQVVTIFSVEGISDSFIAAALVAIPCSAILIVRIEDRVHRFLSTLLAVFVLTGALVDAGIGQAFDVVAIVLTAGVALVWRHNLRTRTAMFAELVVPAGYALVVALFLLVLMDAAGSGRATLSCEFSSNVECRLGAVTSVVLTATTCALAFAILAELRHPLSFPGTAAVLLGIVAIGAVAYSTPGLIAGIGILLLAHDRRSPELAMVAAVFLVVFGSFYYYHLDITLLEKSAVLAGTGAVLLALRQLVTGRRAR